MGVLKSLSYQRSGSLEWVNGFTERMAAAGESVGVKFDFGGDVGNSFDRCCKQKKILC